MSTDDLRGVSSFSRSPTGEWGYQAAEGSTKVIQRGSDMYDRLESDWDAYRGHARDSRWAEFPTEWDAESSGYSGYTDDGSMESGRIRYTAGNPGETANLSELYALNRTDYRLGAGDYREFAPTIGLDENATAEDIYVKYLNDSLASALNDSDAPSYEAPTLQTYSLADAAKDARAARGDAALAGGANLAAIDRLVSTQGQNYDSQERGNTERRLALSRAKSEAQAFSSPYAGAGETRLANESAASISNAAARSQYKDAVSSYKQNMKSAAFSGLNTAYSMYTSRSNVARGHAASATATNLSNSAQRQSRNLGLASMAVTAAVIIM